MAFINTNLRHVGTVGSGARCVLPGTTHGYVCGGYVGKTGAGHPWGPSVYGKMIEKFSLTSDGNAADVADMLAESRGQNGHSSTTHGYITGIGHDTPGSFLNRIERFQFSNDSDCVDWADLTETKRVSGTPCQSETHGFTMGGGDETGPTDVIDKFPFASQTNATDWADCTAVQQGGGGASSPTYGYSLAGGYGSSPSVYVNIIERFPFASQTDSVDVADVTLARSGGAGISSCEDGYCAGGLIIATNPANGAPFWTLSVIDKHSFSSGANSTDHGDLPIETGAGAMSAGGVSGTTHGYSVGGIYSWNASNHQYPREQIEKFAYVSNVTATDVGDLVDADSLNIPHWGMDSCSGHQV